MVVSPPPTPPRGDETQSNWSWNNHCIRFSNFQSKALSVHVDSGCFNRQRHLRYNSFLPFIITFVKFFYGLVLACGNWFSHGSRGPWPWAIALNELFELSISTVLCRIMSVLCSEETISKRKYLQVTKERICCPVSYFVPRRVSL